MKRLIFFFAFCIPLFGYSQTYWNFIMDSCSVNSIPSGSVVRNGKYCNVIQECGFQGTNHLRIVEWDDQLNREEFNNSIQYDEYTRPMYQGISKIHNGYFLANDNSHLPLIKFDDSLQVRWSINLKDSLTATDGWPYWWCEDSLTGDLYGTGNYGYPNSSQCFTRELSLIKMDSIGNVIFKRTYPGIFQNSTNGYLYDFGIPDYIGKVNNEIHVSGGAMQFYPGPNSLSGSKVFFAKFDLDGNLLSLNFMGDKSAYSWVLNDGLGYYIIREETLSEYSMTLSKMQVYHKADIDAEPVLLFEDPNALPQMSWQLYKPIMTEQGILILTDRSNNQSLGAKLIMYDTSTNSIAWQKNYVLDIDSSTVNISSSMGDMGYLVELPDLGFAFCGSVMTNNTVYPWYIRTDACGDEVYNGCTISGVSELVESTSLKLFPNPAVNEINIQLPTTDTWIVRVFNSNGQLVSTERIKQSNFIQLNIQNLNTGLYTVQAMNSAGRVYSEMVVKE
jgi:hypothetical protein